MVKYSKGFAASDCHELFITLAMESVGFKLFFDQFTNANVR